VSSRRLHEASLEAAVSHFELTPRRIIASQVRVCKDPTIVSYLIVCVRRVRNPLSTFALIAQVLTQVGKKTLANTTRGDLGVE